MTDSSERDSGARVDGAHASAVDMCEERLAEVGPGVAAALRIAPQWQGLIEADDIMQVTYIEACIAMRDPRVEIRDLRSWLQRAAENNLRDAIGSLSAACRPSPTARLQPSPGEDPVVWLHRQATSGGTTPSRSSARSEMLVALRAEMSRLPPLYADVLERVVLRGMNHADVGVQLGRSRGAIYLLHQRAIELLRRRMGG